MDIAGDERKNCKREHMYFFNIFIHGGGGGGSMVCNGSYGTRGDGHVTIKNCLR